MKQEEPFIRLGQVDVSPVRRRLLAEPESAWTKRVAAQQGNWPHKDARHISLANSLDGRHFRATVFPAYEQYRGTVTPVLREAARLLEQSKKLIRVQFAWLGAGSSILPHRDTAITLLYSHRVHIPIATNDAVEFECGEESVRMREGEIWTFDNTLVHAVYNRGNTPRIHLIADFAEPLPLRAWLPYVKQRLYRVRNGDYAAHRQLMRAAGGRTGQIHL